MTTHTVQSGLTPLPWLVLRGLRLGWSELPRVLAAGALILAATVPLVLAWLTGAPGWLVATATLPVAVALTGLARFTAALVDGGVPRLRQLTRFDPALAAMLAGTASVTGFGLAAGGAWSVLGAVTGAGLVLVGPLALGYGSLRDRYGVGALRGGLILAGYRPLWVVTLVGLACLGGFAVAATAGVLALVVPPLLLIVTTTVVRQLLTEVDAAQGRP